MRHKWLKILFDDSIIPAYVPLYYRLYLMSWPRLRESLRRRLFVRSSDCLVVPEEEKQEKVLDLGKGREPVINRTFSEMDKDFQTNGVREAVNKINGLKETLNTKGLRFTNFAGNFKTRRYIPDKERNKLWENAWILSNSNVKTEDVVLDIGGASTILSFLLADMGHDVYVVDNDSGNNAVIYNARYVSDKMDWLMRLYNRDITKGLPFPSNFFDKVFCVCVLEHLSSAVRRKVMNEISRVLKTGGLAALSFDYDTERNDAGLDKGLRYSLKRRLIEDVIEPSGLEIYGNAQLTNDCPRGFFLGTLFLKK